jgi:hypothetical protein
LLRAILSCRFWVNKSPIQAYIHVFIRCVSPQIVITFIDNNVSFYSISNRFPELRTIFLQNGTRSKRGDIFGVLVKSASYHVDYMLVHGSAIGRYYRKFISGEVIVTGSLKNNKCEKSSDATDGLILFISAYNPIYKAAVKVLCFLNKWCAQNDKRLQICSHHFEDDGTEKGFYAKYLDGCIWEIMPKSDNYSSYNLVDAAEIVVSLDSTLGYEAFGRGKKTAIFACRDDFQNMPNIGDLKFGWPADLSNNGPFWTNDQDETQFQRVMDYLNTVSDVDLEQEYQSYATELMEFDPGNTRLIALLDQILSKSKSQPHAN